MDVALMSYRELELVTGWDGGTDVTAAGTRE